MGCVDSIPSLIAFLGGSVTPYIYENFGKDDNGGLWKAFLFGSLVCVLSLIVAIGFTIFDSTARKRD
jgi:hypothetical protein